MSKKKQVHIVTGPPGGGKTTFAANHFPTLPVFDSDLGNKSLWRDCPTSCVLMTAAPRADSKDYWLRECNKFGFTDPVLYVCDPGISIAVSRMTKRPGVLPTQHNRLSKTVQRWYRAYSRHPEEQHVESAVRKTESA